MQESVSSAVIGLHAVSEGGYEIRDVRLPSPEGPSKPAPCLVEKNPTAKYRTYDPMEDARFERRELFLRFADLPPWGATEVVAFANEFGPLWLPTRLPDGPVLDEPLALWTESARSLRHTIWIWEQLLGKGDQDVGVELKERLRPVRKDGQLKAWNYDRQLEADILAKLPPGTLERIKPGTHITPYQGMTFREKDVRTPAGVLLSNILRHELCNKATVHVVFDPNQRLPAVRIVPVGLIGAAWFRLGNAIDRKRRIQVCAVCPKWFMVGDGREARRLFCSDACRQKHFRQTPITSKKKGKK